MLIHAIVPVSRVNGPGSRFTVWTQGCGRGCPGCFNPAAQILPDNFFSRAPREYSLLEAANIQAGLSASSPRPRLGHGSAVLRKPAPRAFRRGCGLSAPIPGAPKGKDFDFPGPAELSIEEIISYIPRGKVSGITVSGGEPFLQPEELFRLLAAARRLGLNTLVYSGYTCGELRRLFPGSLRDIDILIDGPYRKDVPRTHVWAGSGNQKIHYLRGGKIIPRDRRVPDSPPEAEIFIDAAGRVTVTGGLSLGL